MKARATDNDLIFESYNNPEVDSAAEQQLSEKEKKEKKWRPPLGGYMRAEDEREEWEEEIITRSKGFLPKDPEVVVANAAGRIKNMQNNSYIQGLRGVKTYTELGKAQRAKHATKFPNQHLGQSIDNHPEVDAVEDFIYDFMDNAFDRYGRPIAGYEFDINKLRELVAAAEKDYPGTKDLPQLFPSLQKAIAGDKGPETKDAAPTAQSGLDFARQQVAASELKQKPAAEAPAAGGEADEADTWWNSLSPEKKQQVVQLLRSS